MRQKDKDKVLHQLLQQKRLKWIKLGQNHLFDRLYDIEQNFKVENTRRTVEKSERTHLFHGLGDIEADVGKVGKGLLWHVAVIVTHLVAIV